MSDEIVQDGLEDELRLLAASREPVPPRLIQAAIAAFGWRDLDSELAELTFDSRAEQAGVALVRGASAPHLMSFQAGELTVDIEVTGASAARGLIGQIVPPQAATVDIRRPDGVLTAEADEMGRFHAANLPPGPLSLRIHATGVPRSHVVTDWISI